MKTEGEGRGGEGGVECTFYGMEPLLTEKFSYNMYVRIHAFLRLFHDVLTRRLTGACRMLYKIIRSLPTKDAGLKTWTRIGYLSRFTVYYSASYAIY